MAGQNTFQNNYANNSGGAIFWNDIEFKTQDKYTKTKYQNNTARLYGDNIGSYAQSLISITLEQYQKLLQRVSRYDPDQQALLRDLFQLGKRQLANNAPEQQITNQQTSVSASDLRSGGEIPTMYLALVDKYGTIVTTASNEKLTIQLVKVSNETDINTYAPTNTGSTDFTSTNGVFIVKNMNFTGAPGSSYRMVLSTSAIDTTKPSNKEYLLTTNKTTIDFNYNLTLRECAVGEKFTDSGACELCPEGTSYSIVKMTEPSSCKSCPSSQAICNGGSQIGPQPGYWRKSNTSLNFIKCLNKNACLGMIPPQYDPQGTCDDAYQGILCANCNPGYSTTSSYVCSKCPDYNANILRILAILILAVVAVVLIVRSTLKGASEKKNVISIFQKILLNHIQLIILTASFDFNWPQMVQNFFKTSEPVGEASTQILSIDCFLNTDDGKNTHTNQKKEPAIPIRIFYFKLLLFSVMPFLLFLLSYLVWGIISLHPNIVNCIDVDGEQRIKNDLEILCYQGQHFFWSMGIALPSLVVWGLGIPFFAFILLLRNRKALDSIQVREKFGFLFRGYKKRFYYWETVIMYRKIALIFIQVYLLQFGVITQALFVFLLLIFFLVLTMTKSPFQTVVLNQLETISLITSMLTIFCGLFFILDIQVTNIQEESQSSSQNANEVVLSEPVKMFFFMVILISNIIFFTFWTIKMIDEIYYIILKKFGSIYILICLCGNKTKYEERKQVILINEENELLREGFLETLKNIKKLYEDGDLVLNTKTLEKVQFYLQTDKILQASGQDPNLKHANSLLIKKKRFERIKHGQEITKGVDGKDFVKQSKGSSANNGTDESPQNTESHNIMANGDSRKEYQGLIAIDDLSLQSSIEVQKNVSGNRLEHQNFLRKGYSKESRNNGSHLMLNHESRSRSVLTGANSNLNLSKKKIAIHPDVDNKGEVDQVEIEQEQNDFESEIYEQYASVQPIKSDQESEEQMKKNFDDIEFAPIDDLNRLNMIVKEHKDNKQMERAIHIVKRGHPQEEANEEKHVDVFEELKVGEDGTYHKYTKLRPRSNKHPRPNPSAQFTNSRGQSPIKKQSGLNSPAKKRKTTNKLVINLDDEESLLQSKSLRDIINPGELQQDYQDAMMLMADQKQRQLLLGQNSGSGGKSKYLQPSYSESGATQKYKDKTLSGEIRKLENEFLKDKNDFSKGQSDDSSMEGEENKINDDLGQEVIGFDTQRT